MFHYLICFCYKSNLGIIKKPAVYCCEVLLTRSSLLNFHNIFFDLLGYRSSPPNVLCKKGALRKKICKIHRKTPVPVSFLKKLQAPACNFIKKDTLAQLFSRESWEIFKNIVFQGMHPVAALEVTNVNETSFADMFAEL